MQGWLRWMAMVTVLLLPAGAVPAAELMRCVGHGGQVSYVEGACAAGSRGSSLGDVSPDRAEAQWQRRRQADISDWQRRNRMEVSQLVAASQRTARARSGTTVNRLERCEQSRRRRDRIRDKEFMHMTYARMNALDDAVSEACR